METSSNPKNRLQEICQKNKWPLPNYSTEEIGCQQFSGTLYHPELGEFTTNDTFASKKLVHMTLASLALEYYQKSRTEMVSENELELRPKEFTIILVDIENMANVWSKLTTAVLDNCLLYGFITAHHSLNDKDELKCVNPQIKIIRTNCTRKNASDTLMSLEAYRLSQLYKVNTRFLLVSKDAFIYPLADILKSYSHRNSYITASTLDGIENILAD